MNNGIITRNDGTWFIVDRALLYDLWSQIIEDLYDLGHYGDGDYHRMVKDLNTAKKFRKVIDVVDLNIRRVIEDTMIKYRNGNLSDTQYINILKDIVKRIENKIKQKSQYSDYENYERAMKGI